MIEQVEAGEHVILTSCLQIKHHNFFFWYLNLRVRRKSKKRIKVCSSAHNSLFFARFLIVLFTCALVIKYNFNREKYLYANFSS